MPTEEWIIKQGDMMRPSKGDFVLSSEDIERIWKLPQDKRMQEAENLYQEWLKAKI